MKSIFKKIIESSFVAFIIGCFVLLLDFLTKFYVQQTIPPMKGFTYPYGGFSVFQNILGVEFSIVHATNKGAAWGMFSDFQFYLIVLRIMLIVGLSFYLLFYNSQKQLKIPLTMILFGAFGNVIDYFLYGHVIDMFHFVLWGYHFPVFNVADSFICIGIFWLLMTSFLKEVNTLYQK